MLYSLNSLLAIDLSIYDIISHSPFMLPIEPPLASFPIIYSVLKAYDEGSCLNFISPPSNKKIL